MRQEKNQNKKQTTIAFLGALSDGGDKKKCSTFNFQEQISRIDQTLVGADQQPASSDGEKSELYIYSQASSDQENNIKTTRPKDKYYFNQP